MSKVTPGQLWVRTVPFKKESHDDAGVYINWIPGQRCVANGPDTSDSVWENDGEGKEYRKVIAVTELPKPYTRRVFYLRGWIAPDGYKFGNTRLRCSGIAAFSAWTNRDATVVQELP